MIRATIFLLLICLGIGYLLGMRIDFNELSEQIRSGSFDASKPIATFPAREKTEENRLTLLRGTDQQVSRMKTRTISTVEDPKQKIEVIK